MSRFWEPGDFFGEQDLRIAQANSPCVKAMENLTYFWQGRWIVRCLILDLTQAACVLPALLASLLQIVTGCL